MPNTGLNKQPLPISTDGTSLSVTGNISTNQSSVATPASSATITTAGIGVARVNPSGNVTSIVLQAGTKPAQIVTVLNESAFTLTMAASGTSNVADGTSDVIAATSGRTYTWDSGTSLWYAGGGSGGGFADPTTTKGDLIAHGSSTTRLAVGNDTYALTADSTQTLGVKWASQGTSASIGDHYLVGMSGQNDTDLTNKIVIPGFSSHPDIRVAGTNDDEFDQNAAGTPSGWSTFGADSPTCDTNSYKSLFHLSTSSHGGASVSGIYKAAPSIPYTVTCKLSDTSAKANTNSGAFLMVMDASTSNKFQGSGVIYGSSQLETIWEYWTGWTAGFTSFALGPDTHFFIPYFRLVVHAANNIDAQYSRNGKIWINLSTGNSQLSNATYVALALNSQSEAMDAYWDWIRFT